MDLNYFSILILYFYKKLEINWNIYRLFSTENELLEGNLLANINANEVNYGLYTVGYNLYSGFCIHN